MEAGILVLILVVAVVVAPHIIDRIREVNKEAEQFRLKAIKEGLDDVRDE